MKNLNKPALVFILLIATLWALKTFNLSVPVTITSRPAPADFSVVGEAKVDVVPDTAIVEAGITVSNARSADSAESQITEVNNRIIAAMRDLGIEDTDLKTSNYSINPNYSYEGRTQQIVGYNGQASVTIKVRNTDQTSAVVTAATEAGANNVQGARFMIDDPQKFRNEARDKAIENAKEQAEVLSKKLRITLGRITNMSEGSTNDTPQYERVLMTKGMIANSAEPEIVEGTQTVSSVVTLYFEIK